MPGDLVVNGSLWAWDGARWTLVSAGGLPRVETRHLRALLNGHHGPLAYERDGVSHPDPVVAHAERAATWLRARGWDAAALPGPDPEHDGLPPGTVYGSR